MAVFYFSLRSPYSWLAYRDLRERHPHLAADLEWVPYFDPDARTLADLERAGGRYLYTPMSKAKSLYLLQDVSRLAGARGLTVSWPVDVEPVWEVPHLAYFVAAAHGLGHEFIAAAYRARWQERRDICDPRTVAALGDELGLDGKELAVAAEDAGHRAAGVQALLRVYRDGAFGVPFMVAGRAKFWGVDRLADFAAAVGGGPVPSTVAQAQLPGEDHAGGCG